MLMFCVNPHHDYVFEIFHKTQYMSSNLIKCMVIVKILIKGQTNARNNHYCAPNYITIL